MRTFVFYVSGHGFGHTSRDIEVINALLAREPNLRIIVRTTAPSWLFDLTVRRPQPTDGDGAACAATSSAGGAVEYHRADTDTGIVQIDSLRLDADASIARARDFMASFETRVAQEAAFLAQHDAALVVADIPPLGVAAASRAGVPSVALGNFTWDWIYAAYPGADDVVDRVAAAYEGATLALRLPMHGGFEPCRTVRDVPFIARRSSRDPREVRQRLDLPSGERLVLVSFGGYGLEGLDLDALARLDGYVALVSGSVPLADLPHGLRAGRRGQLLPFDEKRMYAEGLRYEDVVRAVDVVVTKPGYGIIAECLANDTALLYTSRGHFIEYDVLVEAMPRFLRAGYIDHDALFSGRWTPHLDALLAQPRPPERPPVHGADVIADALLELR